MSNGYFKDPNPQGSFNMLMEYLMYGEKQKEKDIIDVKTGYSQLLSLIDTTNSQKNLSEGNSSIKRHVEKMRSLSAYDPVLDMAADKLEDTYNTKANQLNRFEAASDFSTGYLDEDPIDLPSADEAIQAAVALEMDKFDIKERPDAVSVETNMKDVLGKSLKTGKFSWDSYDDFQDNFNKYLPKESVLEHLNERNDFIHSQVEAFEEMGFNVDENGYVNTPDSYQGKTHSKSGKSYSSIYKELVRDRSKWYNVLESLETGLTDPDSPSMTRREFEKALTLNIKEFAAYKAKMGTRYSNDYGNATRRVSHYEKELDKLMEDELTDEETQAYANQLGVKSVSQADLKAVFLGKIQQWEKSALGASRGYGLWMGAELQGLSEDVITQSEIDDLLEEGSVDSSGKQTSSMPFNVPLFKSEPNDFTKNYISAEGQSKEGGLLYGDDEVFPNSSSVNIDGFLVSDQKGNLIPRPKHQKDIDLLTTMYEPGSYFHEKIDKELSGSNNMPVFSGDNAMNDRDEFVNTFNGIRSLAWTLDKEEHQGRFDSIIKDSNGNKTNLILYELIEGSKFGLPNKISEVQNILKNNEYSGESNAEVLNKILKPRLEGYLRIKEDSVVSDEWNKIKKRKEGESDEDYQKRIKSELFNLMSQSNKISDVTKNKFNVILNSIGMPTEINYS